MAIIFRNIPGAPPLIELRGDIICDGRFGLEVSVNSGVKVPLPISNYRVTNNYWIATIVDNFSCGSTINIYATCLSSNITNTIDSASFTTPPCNDCPTATIAIDEIGDCDTAGDRLVSFEANVSAPGTMPAFGQWRFFTYPNSPTNNPNNYTPGQSIYLAAGVTQLFSEHVSFPAATLTHLHTACIHWSNPPFTNCPDVLLPFAVPECLPPCCPNLNIAIINIRDCVSQSDFSFTVSQDNNCLLLANTNYVWTINGPTGNYQLSSTATTVSTNDPNWKKLPANSLGSVNMSKVGNYTVSVFFSSPASGCNPAGSASFEVKDCCPAGQHWDDAKQTCVGCPTITLQTTIAGCSPGGKASASFSASVSPSLASSFDWEVTDPSGKVFTKNTFTPSTTDGIADGNWVNNSVPGSLNLATPGAYVVRVTAKGTAITQSCVVSKNIAFTIPSCPVVCPPGQQLDANGKCVPIECPPGSHLDSNGKCVNDKPLSSMGIGCWLLLILAFILGIIACIAGIKSSCPCALCPPDVRGILAAAILGAVALGLFILWLALCARGNCGIFNWVRWIIIWILLFAAPLTAILVGIFGGGFLCGLVAGFILWGYWGLILAILEVGGPKIGCSLIAPPFP